MLCTLSDMKLQNQIKRTLSQPEAIVYIRQLLEQEQVATRTELAEWCCEEFGFQDPRGENQLGGCLKGLRELEAKGWFKLPPTQMQKGKPSPRRVQLNVRVTLSAGKGEFWVIPEWYKGVAAGQMDESWINKHGQLDSKGGPWQNAFPKSRSLPGAKQV